MTEFHELVKEAPNFNAIERGELVTYAYAMFAAGTKADSENAKLRELAVLNWEWAHGCCGNNCKMQTNDCGYQIDRECNYEREIWDRMRGLGVEMGG